MITGKWWITTTSQSLPERFYEEFAKVQSGKYGEVYARTKFRDDIQTYGKENFNVVQLKTFDNREEAYAHSEKVRAVWLAMGYEMY